MKWLQRKVKDLKTRLSKESRKKKILMVIGQYHPVVGGMERQAKKLAEKLIEKGYLIDVLTIHRWGLPIRETINGIYVRRVAFYSFGNLKLYLARTIFFLFILIRRNSYCCVHIHGGSDLAVAAVLASRSVGLPTIVKMSTSGERFDLKRLANKSRLWDLGTRRLILSASRFIATTPQIVGDLKSVGVPDSKILLIPNGVHIVRKVQAENKQNSDFKIIVVARLIELKNIAFLIDALKELEIPCSLTVYGDGREKESLIRMVSRNKMSDRVRFAGNVSGEELIDALGSSDLFTLPSKVEGLSNALLEAMSVGLPVLVTDLPSNRFVLGDTLADDCCLPLTKDAWVAGLLRFYRDVPYREKIGRRLKSRVEYFDLNKIAEQYGKLYAEIGRA